MIVIGRGHLIADSSVEDLVKTSSGSFVRLRTPQDDKVAPRLVAAGATVQADGDGALMVSGLEPAAIGDIAFEAGVPVHELSLQEASLEEAFMELTRDDVEFHAQQHGGAPTAHGTSAAPRTSATHRGPAPTGAAQ